MFILLCCQEEIINRPSPLALPRKETIISDPRQWTVCGPDKLVLDFISEPLITLWIFGANGSDS